MIKNLLACKGFAAMLLIAAPPPAQAIEASPTALPRLAHAAPAAPQENPPPVGSDDPLLAGAVLSPEEMKEERGGYTIVLNDQTLIGIVQGNAFNGDFAAGAVSFNDNAFSNFAGMLTLAINTAPGANALAGMSVTINVQDGGN